MDIGEIKHAPADLTRPEREAAVAWLVTQPFRTLRGRFQLLANKTRDALCDLDAWSLPHLQAMADHVVEAYLRKIQAGEEDEALPEPTAKAPLAAPQTEMEDEAEGYYLAYAGFFF